MKEKKETKGKNPDQKTPAPEPEVIVEESMIPLMNPEVTIREEMEEDKKYILFNAENELVLVINPTGKFILDNCDGKKTIGNIIADIKKSFTTDEDMDIPAIVKGFVSTLLKAQLVTI
jgi:hypothetical protein